MRKLLAALTMTFLFSGVSPAFECQRVLKEMKLVELDLLPDQSAGRSIASADSTQLAAKQKRIAQMKRFLEKAPIDKQRAFAILLVNYFMDINDGKTGNLLDGMDLIDTNKNATKVIMIAPNLPNDEILSYLTKTTSGDLNDVRGLIVYLLRAKNMKTSPSRVLAFLKEQIKQGNSHFALLQKNCILGDPTLEKIAAAQANN
jgi:hypothetical protein